MALERELTAPLREAAPQLRQVRLRQPRADLGHVVDADAELRAVDQAAERAVRQRHHRQAGAGVLECLVRERGVQVGAVRLVVEAGPTAVEAHELRE